MVLAESTSCIKFECLAFRTLIELRNSSQEKGAWDAVWRGGPLFSQNVLWYFQLVSCIRKSLLLSLLLPPRDWHAWHQYSQLLQLATLTTFHEIKLRAKTPLGEGCPQRLFCMRNARALCRSNWGRGSEFTVYGGRFDGLACQYF